MRRTERKKIEKEKKRKKKRDYQLKIKHWGTLWMVSLLIQLSACGSGPTTDAEGKSTFSAHGKKLPKAEGTTCLLIRDC